MLPTDHLLSSAHPSCPPGALDMCMCACVFMCDGGWKNVQDELLKSSLACLTRADRDALTCSLFLTLFFFFASHLTEQ